MRESFCCNEIMRNIHLFLTKVAVKSYIYAQAFWTTMIYSSNLFTCNTKYFQTLFGEKWWSFAYSLCSMLKLRSTLHEVAWQFNNLAYSSGLMFGRVISTTAFGSLQGRRQRGTSGARLPYLKSVTPFHVWLAGGCIHPIQYFKNVAHLSGFWPLLLVFGPPAAKSWRRAWVTIQFKSVIKESITILKYKLNFSTSRRFAIFELIKFICFGSTLSYPHKEFFNPHLARTRTKCNPLESRPTPQEV